VTIPQPDVAADERATIDQFLDLQRAVLLAKTDGLDAEQLNRRLAPSELTLGGLLKHLAYVEDDWIQVDFLGRPPVEPWAAAPWTRDRDWEIHSAADDTPEQLRTLYRDACQRSRNAVAAHTLDELSAGRDRTTGERWSLRWILTHLIEETARHNGHADFLREAIDGRTGD
jgi:uncharacterized damage-inducible protein DinB